MNPVRITFVAFFLSVTGITLYAELPTPRAVPPASNDSSASAEPFRRDRRRGRGYLNTDDNIKPTGDIL